MTCPNEGEELESECQERQTNQEASLSCFPGAEGAPLGHLPLGPEVLARACGILAGGSQGRVRAPGSVQNPTTDVPQGRLKARGFLFRHKPDGAGSQSERVTARAFPTPAVCHSVHRSCHVPRCHMAIAGMHGFL